MDLFELGAGAYPDFITHTRRFHAALIHFCAWYAGGVSVN